MNIIQFLRILQATFGSIFLLFIIMAILSVRVPAILFIIAVAALIIFVIANMLRDSKKEANKQMSAR